ncbi:MAG: glucans biosynthesis glucosyltransferase MdoH [Elsteraceae bacterium]
MGRHIIPEDAAVLSKRRMLFLALSLVSMAGLIAAMHRLLATNGLTGIETVQLVCFALTTPWAVIGFWNAVIGFAILRLSSDPAAYVTPALSRAKPTDPITVRVALALFVRHEQASAVIGRLRLMRQELERTGFGRQFHFFLLSDSAIPEYCAEEERLFEALRAEDPRPEELIYRRRPQNAGFKAGNMRDFCERWGDDYEIFIPLDADSLMTGPALLRLARVMQANPNLGILQTLVVGAPATSFFTRAFQFGMRQGMRTYTTGAAWWQGDCGPFWGHNAAIRMAPYRDHCHLPKLPGGPPLGGDILSHDQVEAVLMRRAGWEVRVLSEEGGSWEQNPPALPDFIKRDLRWCQGNMQYFRLLNMPGLLPLSRIQLALAILMYVGAPAWIGFIITATAQAFFPSAGTEPYPVDLGVGLLITSMGMVLAPKIFGILDVLVQRRARRNYGGGFRVLLGAVVEFLFSSLLAPVVSLAETIFMIGLCFGRRILWEAQRREGYRVPWSAAARGLWPQTLFGVALTGALAIAAPGSIAWASPLLVALLLSIPLAVATSSPSVGEASVAIGLCAIPEEKDETALVHQEESAAKLLG